MKFTQIITDSRGVEVLPSAQGFNMMHCETLEDAQMCSVALFNWLAVNEPNENFKETGLSQRFIEGLNDLRDTVEDWLNLI